jgi:colanic acid biosynthesis glycosyl transferase WcaI
MGSLPSKVFSILASGRPIIACIDENCETWELISRADAGCCVAPEDPAKLVEAILSLKNDPVRCAQFGVNGRKWAEEYHSPNAATLQFEKLFQRIITNHRL